MGFNIGSLVDNAKSKAEDKLTSTIQNKVGNLSSGSFLDGISGTSNSSATDVLSSLSDRYSSNSNFVSSIMSGGNLGMNIDTALASQNKSTKVTEKGGDKKSDEDETPTGDGKILKKEEANKKICDFIDSCPYTKTYNETISKWDEKEINAYSAWKASQIKETDKKPSKKELKQEGFDMSERDNEEKEICHKIIAWMQNNFPEVEGCKWFANNKKYEDSDAVIVSKRCAVNVKLMETESRITWEGSLNHISKNLKGNDRYITDENGTKTSKAAIFADAANTFVKNKVSDFINSSLEKTLGKVGLTLDDFKNLTPEKKEELRNKIRGAMQTFLTEKIKDKMEKLCLGQLENMYDKYVGQLTSQLNNTFDNVTGKMLKPLNDISNKLTGITNKISNTLTNIEKLDFAKNLSDSFLGKFANSDSKIGKLVGKLQNSSAFKKVSEKLNNKITGAIQKYVSPVASKVVATLNVIRDKITQVKNLITDYKNTIKNAVKNYVDQLKTKLVEQTKKIVSDIAAKLGASFAMSFKI